MKLSAIIALLFLLLLLLQTGGRWLVFQFSEWQAEWEMERHIRKHATTDQLTVITVHKTETHLLEWMEPHEFRHEGMMYDIVREETKGDSIYYYCLADHKEAALLAHWEKSLEEGHAPLSSSQGEWLRLLQLLSGYYLATDQSLPYPFGEPASQAAFLYEFSVLSWQPVPLLPPPK